MTNVQVQRDGLTLRGVLEIPEGKDKYDMAILMHGFTGNCGRNNPGNLHYQLAQMLKKMGIASVRFGLHQNPSVVLLRIFQFFQLIGLRLE